MFTFYDHGPVLSTNNWKEPKKEKLVASSGINVLLLYERKQNAT